MKLPAARSLSNIDDDVFPTKEQTNEHETHFANVIHFGRFFFCIALKCLVYILNRYMYVWLCIRECRYLLSPEESMSTLRAGVEAVVRCPL